MSSVMKKSAKSPKPKRRESLGSTVRTLRSEKELTQSQLATRAGIDQAVVSRIERGKARQVWPQTIERLAAALGVPTGELFGLAEPEPRSSAMPPTVREIHSLLMAMTDDDRVVVLGVARTLHETRRRFLLGPDAARKWTGHRKDDT